MVNVFTGSFFTLERVLSDSHNAAFTEKKSVRKDSLKSESKKKQKENSQHALRKLTPEQDLIKNSRYAVFGNDH